MEQELEKILNASSPVLVSVVIMFIVWGLKKAPFFADWLLPFAAMALGATFYPMLEGWTPKTVIQGLAFGGLAVAFNQQFKQLLARFGVKVGGDTETFKKTDIAPLVAIGMVLTLCGCSSYQTIQTDSRKEAQDGTAITEVKTTVKARTFFDSKSQLSQFKASQTEKSQSTSVGSLSQESSATNVAPVVKAVFEGIVSGAIKSTVPVPLPKKEEETVETP